MEHERVLRRLGAEFPAGDGSAPYLWAVAAVAVLALLVAVSVGVAIG